MLEKLSELELNAVSSETAGTGVGGLLGWVVAFGANA